MKKIAFIIELAGTTREGGEQKAMLRMADAIRKGGDKVDVYSYISDDNNFKIKTYFPLRLLTLPYIRDIIFLPLIGIQILGQLENKYDVICTSSTTIASFYKPKTKLVTTTHIIRSKKIDTMKNIKKYKLLFNPFVALLFKWLEVKSLSNSDSVIVITKKQQNFLVNNIGIDHSKVKLIPNAIDTDFFKPLGLTKKEQLIFVGRGTVPKGLDTLLSAAPSIKGKIIIATKKIDSKLLGIAKSLSNVEVIFDVTSSDLVRLYSESKVFVLPSLDEEQPLTTLEAMATALPVIVTKKAAINNQYIEGVNIIAEHDDVGLAKSANRLLNTKTSELISIGRKNRDFVIKKFQIQKILKLTIQAINEQSN